MSVLCVRLVAAPFAINIEFGLPSLSSESTSYQLAVMLPHSPAHTDLFSSLSYLFKCVGAVIATKIADTLREQGPAVQIAELAEW